MDPPDTRVKPLRALTTSFPVPNPGEPPEPGPSGPPHSVSAQGLGVRAVGMVAQELLEAAVGLRMAAGARRAVRATKPAALTIGPSRRAVRAS